MTQEEMIAFLWRGSHEFRGRSMEEIADLNDHQIDLLLRADVRPKKTYTPGAFPRLTKDYFRLVWKDQGKSDEWIDAQWEADYGGQVQG